MLGGAVCALVPAARAADPQEVLRAAQVRIDAAIDRYRRTGDRTAALSLAPVEAELVASAAELEGRQDRAGAALHLIKAGQICRMRGEWACAIEHYQRAVLLARQAGHAAHEAKALEGQAQAELSSRDTSAAAEHIRAALVLAPRAGDPSLLFDAFDVQGQIQIKQGDLNAATDSLKRALEVPGVKDDVRLYGFLDRADVFLARGEACDQQPTFEQCQQALDRAREDYRKAGAMARALGWAGLAAQIDGFVRGADQRSELIRSRAAGAGRLAQADLFHPRVPRDVLVTEHFVSGGGGMPPGFAALVAEMQAEQKRAGGFGETARASSVYVSGLQAALNGDHDAALASYLQAIKLLERDRRSLRDEASRTALLEDKSQIYVEAIQELLERRRYGEAFDLMERSRARAMSDILAARPLNLAAPTEQKLYAESMRVRVDTASAQRKLARLINEGAPGEQMAPLDAEVARLEQEARALDARMARAAPRLYHLQTSKPSSLTDIQAMMKHAGADLLEYLVTDTGVILWHINGSEVHVRNVFVPRADVTAKVVALGESASQPGAAFDQRISRELFLQLLQPALSWIRGRRLVVIPHDILNALPMQALEDPADGTPAGARFQIVYAPSATVYADLKPWQGGAHNRVLAVADPSLGAAGQELEALQKIYGAGYRRLGGEELATKAMLKAADGAGAEVWHLAVHGHFNAKDPLLSYLELAPAGGDDGRLTAAEMFGLPLGHTRLVVLSACETARAEVGRSNEVVGMMRGLLYAGAGALVLSSWKVDDVATALWMETFHRAALTRPLAEAAQQALLAVKAKPEYAHPYYWAAFSLVARQ
jgi:CHAT domain-containing protein/tetratricopeptide (TPR) repeat protein